MTATLGTTIALGVTILALPLHAQVKQYDVRAYGAKGDGVTIDSDAINRAIDAATAAGGGSGVLSAGTYASYTIRLKSHVGLVLDQGAYAVPERESMYPEPSLFGVLPAYGFYWRTRPLSIP